MILLIGYLFAIKNISDFVQASAAILFGLFGVRQILIPKDISGETIWDLMVFVLYIFVVYAVVDHLLFQIIKTKNASAEYKFVSSPAIQIYHKINCRYSEKISEEKRIFYSDEADAIKDKKVLCKICSTKNNSGK
jgi:hypothetical protein